MNRCVVLGIDQAATSGAATLRLNGRLEAVSCPRVARDRLAVVRAAVALAGELGVPLVAVLEDHALSGRGRGKGRAERGKWSVASTLLGQGDARGRWCELLELHGVRWTKVSPEAWRPRVLGIRGATATEAAKRAAVGWAEGLFRLRVTHDAAEALALAWWGLHAPEVGALAAMRARSALLEVPTGT